MAHDLWVKDQDTEQLNEKPLSSQNVALASWHFVLLYLKLIKHCILSPAFVARTQKIKSAYESYRKQFGSGNAKQAKPKPKPKVKVPLKKTVPSPYAPSASASAAWHTRSSAPSASAHAEFESLEERLLKELTSHYQGLSDIRRQMINLMWQEEAIQEYCDFMTDYCKLAEDAEDDDSSDTDDDLDDLDLSASAARNATTSKPKKQDGYTFFTKDAKGVHYKAMKSEPGVPLRIEIDVKGFDASEIAVDSVENEMTITMKQKKSVGQARIGLDKTLGIICPTVQDLDKLYIHYPKNGVLLIEGAAAN